jgi:putative toxin-antitoxin system antitoxin component (TIGR02293 family)
MGAFARASRVGPLKAARLMASGTLLASTHMGRHFMPVGQGQGMLPNYDAKAIAEVMGLAFVRGAKEGRPKSGSAGLGDDFTIHVDDITMLIVEITAKNAFAPFDASKISSRQLSHLVSSPSPVFIEKAVESGLPRKALRHLAEWIAGGDKAKISALEWGVVPKSTLERRETKLSPQESERTERVARLFVHARRALGTEAEAREFMTAPHPELDGRSPIDAAKTDLGTRRTEQILNALEYGLAF